MFEFTSATRRFLRRTTVTGLGIMIVATPLIPGPAFARHHHHYAQAHRARVTMTFRVNRMRQVHIGQGSFHPAHIRPGSFTPPFSVYAVDGNSVACSMVETKTRCVIPPRSPR